MVLSPQWVFYTRLYMESQPGGRMSYHLVNKGPDGESSLYCGGYCRCKKSTNTATAYLYGVIIESMYICIY